MCSYPPLSINLLSERNKQVQAIKTINTKHVQIYFIWCGSWKPLFHLPDRQMQENNIAGRAQISFIYAEREKTIFHGCTIGSLNTLELQNKLIGKTHARLCQTGALERSVATAMLNNCLAYRTPGDNQDNILEGKWDDWGRYFGGPCSPCGRRVSEMQECIAYIQPMSLNYLDVLSCPFVGTFRKTKKRFRV